MSKDWVILKSMVGPTTLRLRRYDPELSQYVTTQVDFTIDNSCTDAVPVKWWEENRENPFDRSINRTYKESFEVIGYDTSNHRVYAG